MYKHLGAIAALFVCAITLTGCGNLGGGNINGNWTANLTNPAGTPVFAFQTTFLQTGTNGLSITNFAFTTSSPCFPAGQTSETGSFSLSGNYNGKVTGSLAMLITTTFPSNNNVLNLKGTVNGNTINGTWTATGSGCSGNGTFVANAS